MSGRSTSRRLRAKDRNASVEPGREGAKAFASGLPRSANPYHGIGRGKRHAWEKGWNNARILKVSR